MAKEYSKAKLRHIQSVVLNNVRKYIDSKARIVGGGAIRYRVWNGQKSTFKFGRRAKTLDLYHMTEEQQIKCFEELYNATETP